MTNCSEFDTVLRATANEVYDTANQIFATGSFEMGELFYMDPGGSLNVGEEPESLLTRKLAVEYRTIAHGEYSGEMPILTFSYDELGVFKSLQLWSNNYAENDKVYTIYKDTKSGEYVQDEVQSDDDFQASEDEFVLQLRGSVLGMLFTAGTEVDENALGNYMLEKEMVHTGVPLDPVLMARLLPMLKQAAADLTYI